MTALPAPNNPAYVLEDVSWDFYERAVEEMENSGRHVRITYEDGRMEFMSPSDLHEELEGLIGRLIELYAIERDIPITGLGSVTCKRRDLRKGLEPDECYYVTTPRPPRGDFDLKRYPPPDLAVEVEISRGVIPKQPIYAALGVPEIWRFDGQRIIVLRRQADGQYQTFTDSGVFPNLPIAEFNRFLALALSDENHPTARAFRDWLRKNPSA
jgi:Uma2 family endonuclease